MTTTPPPATPSARRRLAALGTFLLLVAALAVVIASMIRRPLLIPVVIVLAAVCIVAAFVSLTRRGVTRIAAGLVAVAALVGLLAFVGARSALGAGALAVILLAAAACTRYAMAVDLATLTRLPAPGTPVPAARRGVLIMNPKSGGGKVEKSDLEAECRRRGIEAVVLKKGDDLLQLAREAIERGADVVGMAGGDGSQALVASVVREHHEVAFVCIPAGTRNHFALDLGLDRDDVVGSLDAFGEAVERVVDLGLVNDRIFVNNVSLGLYATIVESNDYREHKVGTTLSMLPDVLGPDGDLFDLRHAGPDGVERPGAHVVMVANNPYVLTNVAVFGTRERMDLGTLGIVTLTVEKATDLPVVLARGASSGTKGVAEWSAPTFEVRSEEPIAVGIDGESLTMEAPLVFRSLPAALRVRIPVDAPGYSPAARARHFSRSTLRQLVQVAIGRSETA